MTSPTPQQVLDTLSAGRLVPVVVLDDAAHADPLAAALVAGGLPDGRTTSRRARTRREGRPRRGGHGEAGTSGR